MHVTPLLRGLAAVAVLTTLAACDSTRDGTRGNPPSTALQRAYDKATDAPADQRRRHRQQPVRHSGGAGAGQDGGHQHFGRLSEPVGRNACQPAGHRGRAGL